MLFIISMRVAIEGKAGKLERGRKERGVKAHEGEEGRTLEEEEEEEEEEREVGGGEF